ncbi:MAG: four helix bundle protein [Alphaproteobacteria bacterium]|uniref:Four helix bundle protein n=1 Tax=Candidatus Nitrobium versatile TaxID=2884831 RepID=A0A953M1J2_9BACT|nr:four helix bundle protein [Candidatus Nitrobium versatile]
MPKSFEELPVWQKARELVRDIYILTGKEPFKRDFSLVDQIRRASVSVMSNISEGFERGSNAEFIQFLYVAKGSAGEVRTQLYVAFDQAYVAEGDFRKVYALCMDISGQISKFIEYLKSSRMKGEKYRTEYKSFREGVEGVVNEFKIQNSKFKTNGPEG